MVSKFYSDIQEIFNKLKVFDSIIGSKDCHKNDFFVKNSFCEIYQTDVIYSEFKRSWDVEKNDFKTCFLKTNHICITNEIFREYQKFKNFSEEEEYELVFSGLNILTASDVYLYNLNKKIQTVCELDFTNEIVKLINNANIQKNLQRISQFYDIFSESFLISLNTNNIFQNRYQISNNSIIFSLNSDKFEKLRNLDDNKFVVEDFLYLVPPINEMKILMNSNLNYLLNWRIFKDFTTISKYLKRYTNESIYDFLKKYYPEFEIQFEEIIGVVDRRNLNKSTARIVIFNSIDL